MSLFFQCPKCSNNCELFLRKNSSHVVVTCHCGSKMVAAPKPQCHLNARKGLKQPRTVFKWTQGSSCHKFKNIPKWLKGEEYGKAMEKVDLLWLEWLKDGLKEENNAT